MSDEHDETLERLAQALRLLDSLGVDSVEEQQGQDEILRRSTELILGAIEDCVAVSITRMGGERGPLTVASTVQWAVELDEEQYLADDGPCLEAARLQIVQRVDYGAAVQRWPQFVAASEQVGVGSYLSAGLLVDGQEPASVNLYGRGRSAFDALDESLIALITRYVTLALTSQVRLDDSRKLVEQLEEALHTRPVIDWAVGILMAQTPCTPARAFELLRTASQRSNVKLRDLAAQIVERTAQRGESAESVESTDSRDGDADPLGSLT